MLSIGIGPTIGTALPLPFALSGILSNGQSLSIGTEGVPVISTSQPYSNVQLHDTTGNYTNGLFVWLDASTGFTPSAWADQSGNARSAVQATSARQPSVSPRTLSGKPLVYFDASSAGNEKFMTLPTAAGLTSAHAFLVNKRLVAVPAGLSTSGLWDFSINGAGSLFPFTDGTLYEDFGIGVQEVCGAPVVALNTANIYEVQLSATGFKNLINGTVQYTDSSAQSVSFASTPRIGASFTSNIAFYDGDWAELIVFDRVLSSQDRSDVVMYLNAKWGLSGT